MKKTREKVLGVIICISLIFQIVFSVSNFDDNNKIYATESSHWYSQKGWTYNGKTLTSLCYITSYAMVLKSLGFDVNPVDVYVANGKTNYCYHSKIASYYGVDATSEAGSLTSYTKKQKQDFIKGLLEKYPQGVIVGGAYSGGTHYIVAKKVVDDEILFDDPAFDTESAGCCITVDKIYKHTWNTLTAYRVVKLQGNATMKPTTVPTGSAVVVASPNPVVADPVADGKKTATPKPTTKVTPTATVKVVATASAKVIPTATSKANPANESGKTPEPIATETVHEETGSCVIITEPTASPTTVPTVVPTATPVYNPLNKYTVPTRTIYYQSKMMTGDDVKWVEKALKKLGYSIKVNGKFERKDANAVKKYQKARQLSPDCYFGKKTIEYVIKDLTQLLLKVETVTVKLDEVDLSKKSCDAVVSWKKASKAKGYCVYYSRNKKFTTKTAKYCKGTKVTLTNLKEGKTYYIKVRAYKIEDKKKVYGRFSTIKKVIVA